MVEKGVATEILPACSAADFCGLRTTIHIAKEKISPCGKGLKDIVLKLLHSEVVSGKGNNEKINGYSVFQFSALHRPKGSVRMKSSKVQTLGETADPAVDNRIHACVGSNGWVWPHHS